MLESVVSALFITLMTDAVLNTNDSNSVTRPSAGNGCPSGGPVILCACDMHCSGLKSSGISLSALLPHKTPPATAQCQIALLFLKF